MVRADISRLPFVSSSIDAVHAGAALHCWPSPSAAVSIYFTRQVKSLVVLVLNTRSLQGIPFFETMKVL